MRRAIAATTVLAAATLLAPAATATTASATATTGTAAARAAGDCARGDFCAWPDPGFQGERRTWDLSTAGAEECVPLPPGTSARSFANRTGHPVTTFQDRECATEGEFDTYPGGGTWVPDSPYAVRAVKVWEN